jgi:ubiquinol-cytochrome c reductase iron-sulfur subunit
LGPFTAAFWPACASERALPVPLSNDIGVEAGEMQTVEWRGKPVWILKRTPQQLEGLKKTDSLVADPQSQRKPDELTPEYARNEYRSRKPEVLVAVGICSHLGCSPTAKLQPGAQPSLPDDWQGGFFCPCHGSMFDLAGRVYKDKPAPDNLEVPPHMYLSDSKLLIGEDKKA